MTVFRELEEAFGTYQKSIENAWKFLFDKKVKDLPPIEALTLYIIGEDKVRPCNLRGLFDQKNPAYILNRLTAKGYLHSVNHNRKCREIKLTVKGLAMLEILHSND